MRTFNNFKDMFNAKSKSDKPIFNDSDLVRKQWAFHLQLTDEFVSRVRNVIRDLVDEYCDEYGVYLKPGVDACEAINVKNPELVFHWELFDF